MYTSECLTFVSYLVAFSSPGIAYRAAVFQACKTNAFIQSNALVLIAENKIFF